MIIGLFDSAVFICMTSLLDSMFVWYVLKLNKLL